MSVREKWPRPCGAREDLSQVCCACGKTKLVSVGSGDYGSYQDILTRVPSIRNAEKYLGWKPVTDFKTALRKTLDYPRPTVELET